MEIKYKGIHYTNTVISYLQYNVQLYEVYTTVATKYSVINTAITVLYFSVVTTRSYMVRTNTRRLPTQYTPTHITRTLPLWTEYVKT
jgi:hypothetical protein